MPPEPYCIQRYGVCGNSNHSFRITGFLFSLVKVYYEYFVYISHPYILAECEVNDDCWKNEDGEGEDVLCMGGSCRTYEWIEDQFCVNEMNKKSDQRNILSTLRKSRKA